MVILTSLVKNACEAVVRHPECQATSRKEGRGDMRMAIGMGCLVLAPQAREWPTIYVFKIS